MNLPYNGLNIVTAGENVCDHFFIQRALLSSNGNHRHTSVYSHTQLMDYLLKKGSYQNCPEPRPDCILLSFNQPGYDVKDIVRHIHYFPELENISIFVLNKTSAAGEKDLTVVQDPAIAYDVEQGYEPLAEFLQHHTASSERRQEAAPANRMAAA